MALRERPGPAGPIMPAPTFGVTREDSASIQPVQDIGVILREGSRIIFGHKAGITE